MARRDRQALDVVTYEPAAAPPAPSPAPRAPTTLSRLLGAAHGGAVRYGFYAALRRLEALQRSAPRFGEALDPAHEPIRLGQDASLAFRAAAFDAVFDGDARRRPRLAATFFGLLGPHGALPLHLTQYVYERRRRHGDGTLTAFLDIFHHRLLSLRYRVWADAQPAIDRDRPALARYPRHLGALIGQSTSAEPVPTTALDEASLFSALHFAAQTRHAEGLVKVLHAYFGVPVAIEEFIGQWLSIPDEHCWRVPAAAQGVLGVLGESTRVGTEIWDRQAKFRVVLGPVSAEQYARFLPGAEGLAQLTELVLRYAGPELAWDVRLVLREPDQRPASLGIVGQIGRTAHLGGDQRDAAAFQDLVFDPLEHAA
jgi:type VI secretion system protein ImpH